MVAKDQLFSKDFCNSPVFRTQISIGNSFNQGKSSMEKILETTYGYLTEYGLKVLGALANFASGFLMRIFRPFENGISIPYPQRDVHMINQ
jgi:small-conductance mechanosensitive channel